MAVADRSKKKRTATGLQKSNGTLSSQTSLAYFESLTMPLVQEVVISADFRCAECQKRVAHLISKMNGETESVVISVLEKKVILTCTYPHVVEVPPHQVAAIYRNPLKKIATIKRLFLSSCTFYTSKRTIRI
ncbi:uncharacterized protein LOC132295239 [Cornus florida]|uniref:uncharacterized protein LOC132295239 n=1 Tax=Cornus florida TaxID=4283 RepID=UPI00289D5BCD|nr:uncharacterized protein LOC132295239 [Cornus florida]